MYIKIHIYINNIHIYIHITLPYIEEIHSFWTNQTCSSHDLNKQFPQKGFVRFVTIYCLKKIPTQKKSQPFTRLGTSFLIEVWDPFCTFKLPLPLYPVYPESMAHKIVGYMHQLASYAHLYGRSKPCYPLGKKRIAMDNGPWK
jgi:hypothetical protein